MGNGKLPKGFIPDQQEPKLPIGFIADDVPLKKKKSSSWLQRLGGGGEAGSSAVLSEEKDPFRDGLPETQEDIDRRGDNQGSTSATDVLFDPFGLVLKPLKQQADKSAEAYYNSGQQFKQPAGTTAQKIPGVFIPKEITNAPFELKKKSEKDKDTFDAAYQSFYEDAFRDGKEAGEYLEAVQKKFPKEVLKGNVTAGIAQSRFDRYNNLKKELEINPDIDNYAVEINRKNNPVLDKQITALENSPMNKGALNYTGILPSVVQGRFVDELINDPDFKVIVEENPILKQQYEYLKDGGVYQRYPQYGEYVARNILSREYEKRKGNAVANVIFDKSKYLDKLSDEVFKDNPSLKKIADERLKGNWEGKIDTGGTVDAFATGAKESFSSAGESIKDIFGEGKNEQERIYEELSKSYGTPSAGVTGWRSNLNDAFHFGGMITAMAAQGGVTRGLGLTPKATNAIVTTSNFLDTELNKAAMKFPGEDWKQKLSAFTNVALYNYASNIFNTEKFRNVITGASKPLNKEIGALSADATAQEVKNSIMRVVANTTKGAGKGAGEMLLITKMGQELDKVLGLEGQFYDAAHPANEDFEVAQSMFLGLLAPKFIEAAGNRNAVSKSLYNIADNPLKYKSILEMQLAKHPEMEKEISKKVEDIDFLSKIKTNLDANGITEKNQKRYLLEGMNAKYQNEKRTASPDEVIKKGHDASVKRSEEIMERILKGEEAETIITKDEQKAIEEKEKNDIEFERLTVDRELANKKIDAKIEETDGRESEANRIKLQELKEEKKRVNEDFDKKLSKLTPPEKLTPEQEVIKKALDNNEIIDTYRPIAEAALKDVEQAKQFLEEAKSQINSEQSPELGDSSSGSIKSFGKTISDHLKQKADEAAPIQETTEVVEPVTTNKEKETGNISSKPIEAAEGRGEKPPTGEAKASIYVERPATELSHKGLQNVSNEFSLPDVKTRDRKSDVQLRQDARNTVNEWAEKGDYAKNVEELIKDAEAGEVLKDKDRVILEGHLANLSAELRGIKDKNSKEFNTKLDEITRLKQAGEKTRSEAGAALRIPGGGSRPHPIQDYADAMVTMKEAVGTKEFTEKDKAEVETLVKEYEQRATAAEQKVAEMEQRFAELQAKKGVEKKKKSSTEYKSERENIRQSIKEKWSAVGKDGTLSATVPYAKQLAAIAPDVAKLVKSYISEGVTEFAEVVKKVHDFIKEFNPDIQESDVVDMIAGKYNAVKETKVDLEKKLKGIKDKKSEEAIKIRARIKSGDFAKKELPTSWVNNPEMKEKFPKQYKEALDALSAKEQAQLDFDIAVYKAQRAQRTTTQKGIDLGRSIIATTKAIKSGIDDSAVMMQNLVAMVSHPRSAVKAIREHALDAVSEKRFRRYLTELHNSPIWPLIEKSGLDITDPKSLKEQNKEEIFDNNLLNKDIKIRGKKYNLGKYITRPFERAFTSLGNAMRVNMFTRISERMMQEGKTFESHPEEYKSLARVLNTETGRGKLHTQIERASQLVTAGIWSPRLMSSRINMLGLSELAPLYGGKGYYAGLTPTMRKMAIADMVKFLGAGVSLMAFAGSQGATVDDDPESPTFGTIQIGEKKYNAWGGMTPYAKTVYQSISGHRNIQGERKPVTPGKLLGSFFRSRLTPAAGVTTNLLTGKDFAGKPITAGGEISNLMLPLSISAIKDAVQKDGMTGILNQGLPSFIGIGVSDQRDFKKEDTSSRPSRPSVERPERPTREQ